MRPVVIALTLCGALYVLWGTTLIVPQQPGATSATSTPSESRVEGLPLTVDAPRRAVTLGVPSGSMDAEEETGLSQDLGGRPRGVASSVAIDPLNEPVEDAPLNEPLPEVRELKPWLPSRSEEALRAHGLLGIYTGWLKEAERLGWRVERDALSATRDGVRLNFSSRDGMLQRAEVRFDAEALSDSMMDLGFTLLGQEALYLHLEPPFEREVSGWSEQRSVKLPSGRTVALSLIGRSSGSPPYGPELFSLTITELQR